MKDIYILGAGGHAKEICFLIQDINRISSEFKIKGFVDKESSQPVSVGGETFPVFSENEVLEKAIPETAFALGIGDPKLIEKVSARFSAFQFPNLIHPAVIGDWSEIDLGRGITITAGCVLTTSIKFGDFVCINRGCGISHDCQIGTGTIINPGSNISGGVKIGDHCLIGVGSTILQYITIGDNSILGAGAVLTRDLPSNSLAVGVPAKVVKELKK